jgi:hypothetical protein
MTDAGQGAAHFIGAEDTAFAHDLSLAASPDRVKGLAAEDTRRSGCLAAVLRSVALSEDLRPLRRSTTIYRRFDD